MHHAVRAHMRHVLDMKHSAYAPPLLPYGDALRMFIEETHAHALEHEYQENIKILLSVEQSFPMPCFCPALSSMERVLGPDWPGHALRFDPVFWHQPLKEPDVTKLIAKVLHDNLKNIRAFLQALSESCGLGAANTNFMPARLPVTVQAEAPAQGNRIDLLLTWGEGEKARVVVIEAKFDAEFNNPVQAYEAKAQEVLKERQGGLDEKNILHVLLIQHADCETKACSGDKLSANWRIAYWQDLLPHWEKHLKTAYGATRPYPTLGAVRHSIFKKITGGPHVC